MRLTDWSQATYANMYDVYALRVCRPWLSKSVSRIAAHTTTLLPTPTYGQKAERTLRPRDILSLQTLRTMDEQAVAGSQVGLSEIECLGEMVGQPAAWASRAWALLWMRG